MVINKHVGPCYVPLGLFTQHNLMLISLFCQILNSIPYLTHTLIYKRDKGVSCGVKHKNTSSYQPKNMMKFVKSTAVRGEMSIRMVEKNGYQSRLRN